MHTIKSSTPGAFTKIAHQQAAVSGALPPHAHGGAGRSALGGQQASRLWLVLQKVYTSANHAEVVCRRRGSLLQTIDGFRPLPPTLTQAVEAVYCAAAGGAAGVHGGKVRVDPA